MNTPPLLQVRGLRVRFGAKEVVQGVDFSIAPGERLALVGESGSGKSITALSLLRLAGEAQVQGQALLRGRDLLSLSEREMRGVRGGDIAMVFQEPMTALNPLMTVGAQIAEVLQEKKALSQYQSAQAAIELLAKTGIPEPARRAQSYPHQLSGGQRQRAMLAGGVSRFELPAYHSWLSLPDEARAADLAGWIAPVLPAREGTRILLELLRRSGKTFELVARGGQFQQMSGGRSVHLLRVTLEAGTDAVPELSANKYAINVRFIQARPRRGRALPVTADIPFTLTHCRF